MKLDNYHIEDNTLFVEFEPYNEVEDFAMYCHQLLECENTEIKIYFSDKVFFLNSQYIGVLMMTVAGAKRKDRGISISCSKRLARMLYIIGGGTLNFDLRDDLVEDINYYKHIPNDTKDLDG